MTNEKIDMCPCGSGKKYADCCEPVITGKTKAATAEALMRARYTAYVVHEIDFIVNTCKEGEGRGDIDRKATEDWSKQSVWHGMKILRTDTGAAAATDCIVEFEADYTRHCLRDTHHETAASDQTDGEWRSTTSNLTTTPNPRPRQKYSRSNH